MMVFSADWTYVAGFVRPIAQFWAFSIPSRLLTVTITSFISAAMHSLVHAVSDIVILSLSLSLSFSSSIGKLGKPGILTSPLASTLTIPFIWDKASLSSKHKEIGMIVFSADWTYVAGFVCPIAQFWAFSIPSRLMTVTITSSTSVQSFLHLFVSLT